MNIILILLNYLSLSLQNVQTYIFCDDHLEKIYEYDKNTHSYRTLPYTDKGNLCYDPDYINLDVEPGAFIKFDCLNTGGPTLGGACFLINNRCRCYDFDINGKAINDLKDPWPFTVQFSGKVCSHNAKYLQQEQEGIHVYYYNVPLDVDQISCYPFNITAPTNIESSVQFSKFITSSFNVKNLNIGVIKNYKYFTFNKLPISEYDQFNIYSDLKIFSNQTSKINIKFRNYGVVLKNNKDCDFNIRFCYDSCLNCYDIEPNEISHQCLKCKENFYFIENTKNCKTKEQMKNSSYYFDNNKNKFRLCDDSCLNCYDIEPNETFQQCSKCKEGFYFVENTSNCLTKDQMNNSKYSHYYFDNNKNIFRQCLNECSTCDNETYCTNCAEGYHFIYNEIGKCITEPIKEDLVYLNVTNNTYLKCPEKTEKVENNECIEINEEQLPKKNNNIAIITILIIVILIIIIALFFFIKRYVFKKNLEKEIPMTLEKNSSDNKLINIFL